MGFKTLFLVLAILTATLAVTNTSNMLKQNPETNNIKITAYARSAVENYAMRIHPAFVGLISITIGLMAICIYKRVKTQDVKTQILFSPKKQKPLSKTKSDLISI